METSRSQLALRLAALLLAASALALGSVARAQEPDPDPDPEEQAADEADDAEEAQDVEDGAEADEPEAEPDADEPDQADVADAVDEEDVPDEADAATEEYDLTEDWAPEVVVDATDDAIPTDSEIDPSGEAWEAVAFEDDGDNREDLPDTATADSFESGDMPIVRQAVRRGKTPGARPGAAVKPGSRRPGDGDEDTPYSTGGTPVREHGVPWQAQIYYPKSAPQWKEKLGKGVPLWQLQHMCGGTLIAADWVLTAAHCIDDGMVKVGYQVRLGANDISKNEGVSFRIDRIVRHSRYDEKLFPAPPPNMYANDIALIHIVPDDPTRRIDPAQIRPIPLYEKPVPAGAEVTGTGWGKTAPVDNHAPNAVLLKVDLRVMDTETCRKLPNYGPERIGANVICAAHPARSTCRGDSGGPLILTNGAPAVVGVISWGKKRCSGDGQPGVYTRIESYLGWIKQAMQLDPTRSSLP